ncbi:MAG: UDP-N-acetylmuramoyl-L-alanine--D-glutamate ligase [Puniceicoccales bacterium]|jgi:UDP-N-acetylmuramoylalanine--D-glutamate ligase|nr:UDP-N-acetylmuramoyl-L-alanine--D-glutamate ligase [Puniceicoccales bacterium]
MQTEKQQIIDLSGYKPIGIFGAGVTAKGIIQFLDRHAIPYDIYDQDSTRGYPFDEKQAERHRLILCSPSFMSQHPWVRLAQKSGCSCLQEFDFSSRFTRAKLIGITGTNGKTTTVAFLAHALQTLGFRSFTAGNIGQPLSQVLASSHPEENDWIFCEISSAQAEFMRATPLQALIWTNFATNHLYEHEGLQQYFLAKYHLLSFLKHPQFFCGQSVLSHALKFHYELPYFTQICRPSPEDRRWKSTLFDLVPQRENIALIQAFWKCQGWPIEKLLQAAPTFKPLPYRLQRLSSVHGRAFWNDAKSTTFSSTIAAFHQFTTPILWIGGGREKGEPKKFFLKEIQAHVAHAFLIGEEAEVLYPLLKKQGTATTLSDTLERAVRDVMSYPIPEKKDITILFSPGYPSFDQFKNFMERGETFEKLILSLS